jgi:acyl-coenzyme A thioesterase PaaI-like protein
MPTEDDRLVFDQSRTVTWALTAPFHPRMAKMSGREVLEAIQAGLLAPPPLPRVIGFHIGAVGDGRAEFTLEPRGDLENLAGALHGGVAASRSTAFVEGAVTNSQGEVCAQAVATFAVSDPEEI